MQLGLDQLVDTLRTYDAQRVGVLCHAASIDSRGEHLLTKLARELPNRISAIFGPEHGVAGLAEDMEHVATGRDATHAAPIFSLYGETVDSLRPTPDMLAHCDCLVVDLQDVGARYYTYIYTMAFCMEACSNAGIPIIICDRPNPINGVSIEGGLVDADFHSFVGQFPLPNRHGMSIGELAQFFNIRCGFNAELQVITMQGWQRHMHWDDTGLAWQNPSPNMRSLHAALLYPGMCLLEATNISEGRGCPMPFDVCGAPWIDAAQLGEQLRAMNFSGIDYQETHFIPETRKFAGEQCHGLQFSITDRNTFQPYQFGLGLLWALRAQDPEQFGWRTPEGNAPHSGLDAGPYEYVTDRPAIDLLAGSHHVREALDANVGWQEVAALAGDTPADFLAARKECLLYV